MGVLTKEALENLKYYKYSGVDRSLCVKYFLGAFWNALLRFLPLWLASVSPPPLFSSPFTHEPYTPLSND